MRTLCLLVVIFVLNTQAGALFTNSTSTFAVASTNSGRRVLTIQTPSRLEVFQRTGTNGSIYFSGYAEGWENVEARFGTGSWTTIATSVNGYFTGTLLNQPQGSNQVQVRLVTTTNTLLTIDPVGVGDVYEVGGQSNAQGAGTNRYSFAGPQFGSMFATSYSWAELTDPTQNISNCLDSCCCTPSGGSLWPLVGRWIATNQSAPVAFVPSSVGGTAIIEWQTNLWRASLFGSMAARASTNYQHNGVKCLLWWQGESDASAGTSTATYQLRLATMASNYFALTGKKVMACTLPTNGATYATGAAIETVNTAIRNTWTANPSVILRGPELVDVSLASDPGTPKVHLTSEAGFMDVSHRWWLCISNEFYAPGGDYTNGLGGWWKLDDGSGTTATDSKGLNNGTLVSPATWTSNSRVGAFAVTNSGTGYISTALNAHYLNQSFTVMGWFQTTNNASQAIVANGGSTNGWGVMIASGAINLNIRDSGSGGGATRNRSSSNTFTNGAWTHFAGVFTINTSSEAGNAVTLYTNGVLSSLTTLTETGVPANANTSSTLSMGARRYPQAPLSHFVGSLDEIRIYTNALSSAQIWQVYTNQ